jgi:hypothetical protein
MIRFCLFLNIINSLVSLLSIFSMLLWKYDYNTRNNFFNGGDARKIYLDISHIETIHFFAFPLIFLISMTMLYYKRLEISNIKKNIFLYIFNLIFSFLVQKNNVSERIIYNDLLFMEIDKIEYYNK